MTRRSDPEQTRAADHGVRRQVLSPRFEHEECQPGERAREVAGSPSRTRRGTCSAVCRTALGGPHRLHRPVSFVERAAAVQRNGIRIVSAAKREREARRRHGSRSEPFAWLPGSLLVSQPVCELSGPALAVFLLLNANWVPANTSKKSGRAFLSYSKAVQQTGRGRSSIARAFRELASCGLIKLVKPAAHVWRGAGRGGGMGAPDPREGRTFAAPAAPRCTAAGGQGPLESWPDPPRRSQPFWSGVEGSDVRGRAPQSEQGRRVGGRCAHCPSRAMPCAASRTISRSHA